MAFNLMNLGLDTALGLSMAAFTAGQKGLEVKLRNEMAKMEADAAKKALMSNLLQLGVQEREALTKAKIDKFNIMRTSLRRRGATKAAQAAGGAGGAGAERALTIQDVITGMDLGLVEESLSQSLMDFQIKRSLAIDMAEQRVKTAKDKRISTLTAGLQVASSALEGFTEGKVLATDYLGLENKTLKDVLGG